MNTSTYDPSIGITELIAVEIDPPFAGITIKAPPERTAIV